MGMEEAAQKRSSCHSCHFLSTSFYAKKLRTNLLSLSFKGDINVPKRFNGRHRAEGVEILQSDRRNNWSKNSPILHEEKKGENEASVSARFCLLNLCLFSIWDNVAIQPLHLISQAGYSARPPQWQDAIPAQLQSHQLVMALLLVLASVRTHTQLRGHCAPSTSGQVWGRAWDLQRRCSSF